MPDGALPCPQAVQLGKARRWNTLGAALTSAGTVPPCFAGMLGKHPRRIHGTAAGSPGRVALEHPGGKRLLASGPVPCREGGGKAGAAGPGGNEPRGPGVRGMAEAGMLFSPARAGGGGFGHGPQPRLAPLC